jgi:phage-related protein
VPKNLSVASVIEKNRVASNIAWVPLIEVDVADPNSGALIETLYFARNPDDIAYNGNTYIASAFDFDLTLAAAQQPQVTVTIHDLTRVVQAQMQAYGGGIGFTVRLIIVNSGNLAQPPEVEEDFTVVSASAQNYDVTFGLGAENPIALRFPRRRQFRDQCQWRYKGTECGYNGGLPSCDFTLNGPNGCTVHDNAARFGAFPGISINLQGV